MTMYEGEPGWSGPLRIRTEGGRPVKAQCFICGEVWQLEELAADKLSHVLGAASCPNQCEAIPEPGQRRAEFRPQSDPPHRLTTGSLRPRL